MLRDAKRRTTLMRSDFVCNRILSLRSLSHKLESLQASYPQYVSSALIMSCCQVSFRRSLRASLVPMFERLMGRIWCSVGGGKSFPCQHLWFRASVFSCSRFAPVHGGRAYVDFLLTDGVKERPVVRANVSRRKNKNHSQKPRRGREYRYSNKSPKNNRQPQEPPPDTLRRLHLALG